MARGKKARTPRSRFRRIQLPAEKAAKVSVKAAGIQHHKVPRLITKIPYKLRQVHKKVNETFLLKLDERLKGGGTSQPLRGRENILGIGIGEKVTNGRFTGQPCITFHVLSKVHNDELKEDARIPKEIDGVPTDVIVSRVGYPLQAQPKPMQPGESIRNIRGGAGTLGCLVARGRDLCLLSNNHIIALSNDGVCRNPAHGVDGDRIMYEVTLTTGATEEFSIGYLFDFPSIFFNSGENGVDCAIAVTDPSVVDPANVKLGRIDSRPSPPTLGAPVQKFGRHGYSSGHIRYLEQPVDLDYGAKGVARFVGQILIEGSGGGAFATRGDSGALVVDLNNRPVGLIFGGVGGFTVATPIKAVLDRLGVSLVVNF